MCGIAGYVGEKEALDLLMDSLERVSYRGYDSFGVAVQNNSAISMYKATGSVQAGRSAASGLLGSIGIGHTRWATVGKVSRENAHPHLDCEGRIAVVHNGDIDNYFQIRRLLQSKGHTFRSETDSEVVAHLIESHMNSGLDLLEAVTEAVSELEGSYAVIALHHKLGQLVVARKESPIILALGNGEAFAASDVPAVLPYTNRVIYLEDGDVARLSLQGVEVWSGGKPVTRKVHEVAWSVGQLDRGGYEHYMLKEIYEQPQAVRDTLALYMESGASYGHTNGSSATAVPGKVLLLGCGTSYHACLIAKQVLERTLPIPVEAHVASEYVPTGRPTHGGLAVVISQSGETADTLSALKQVKKEGYKTLGITNVMGSSITRLVDNVLYTKAGPEVAVAATKTFISQLAALYALGTSIETHGKGHELKLPQHVQALPNHIRRVLSQAAAFEALGKQLARHDNLFIIARGVNLPAAYEGALKFKEVAYVHAEGISAGELKHGPFALLGPQVPVIAIVPQDETHTRMLTAIREIKARGSPVIALADQEDNETMAFADEVLPMPHVESIITPVLNAVALQLMSYYCARERGCPIDRPRNLAKSVTVP